MTNRNKQIKNGRTEWCCSQRKIWSIFAMKSSITVKVKHFHNLNDRYDRYDRYDVETWPIRPTDTTDMTLKHDRYSFKGLPNLPCPYLFLLGICSPKIAHVFWELFPFCLFFPSSEPKTWYSINSSFAFARLSLFFCLHILSLISLYLHGFISLFCNNSLFYNIPFR